MPVKEHWYSGAWRTPEGIARRREAAKAEYRKSINRKLRIYTRLNERLNAADAERLKEVERAITEAEARLRA